jgi:MerR family mercuric resistance operon transcriptional regulator
MHQSDRPYRIGEIAQETGVTVEALRYYERLGLLPSPPRTEGGARRYGRDVVDRVRFIKQAQTLGLTLREVLELVGEAKWRTGTGCRRVHGLLTRHLEDIDRRLAELRSLRHTLGAYRKSCEAALEREHEPSCPTLNALEETRR